MKTKIGMLFTPALVVRKRWQNSLPKRIKWSDRRKVVFEPLFTTYVFVKASESEMTALRQTDGVVSLVYWLNKPAVIPEKEIEAIRVFLQEHYNVSVQKTTININDRVRITGGPLVAHEGQIMSVKRRTVKVSLPTLGYMMNAEVETADVEVMQRSLYLQPETKYSLPVAR
jgi:transcription antitermination factor NusG